MAVRLAVSVVLSTAPPSVASTAVSSSLVEAAAALAAAAVPVSWDVRTRFSGLAVPQSSLISCLNEKRWMFLYRLNIRCLSYNSQPNI